MGATNQISLLDFESNINTLVVEQPQWDMGEDHLVLIGGLDALGVHDASTRSGEVFDPALPGPVYIVGEREERVASARHAVQLRGPLFLLFRRQRRGDGLEKRLPLLLLATFQLFTTDVQVDGISLLGALDSFLEGQRQHARMVSEPPIVGLGTCESSTVNA